MPTRSRSHQLEDLSIKRFETLLPDSWVVRRKEKDYGSDLEIEIFEADGKATGLAFLVQLRATDKEERAKNLSLTVEQLEYFRSLDLPTLVVRFCSTDDSFYCEWHFNIHPNLSSDGQKSFTYHFSPDQLWHEGRPGVLKRTLETRKLVRQWPPARAVRVVFHAYDIPTRERYQLEGALTEVISGLSDTLVQEPSDELSIDVSISQGKMRVGIDCLASITFEWVAGDIESFRANLLYGITYLLSRQGLAYHAARLARLAIQRSLSHPSRMLSFEMSVAALPDIESSVSLALANGLQESHDPYYAFYLTRLLNSAAPEESDHSVERFFEHAIASAASIGPDTEAAVQYSLGNFFRSRGKFGSAVRSYQLARRLRPEYLKTAYFVRELGSCMYLTKHFKAAICCYEQAFSDSPSARELILLGDARLFAGNVKSAEQAFVTAAEMGDDSEQYEAVVKGTLCSWMSKLCNSENVPVRRWEAARALRSTGAGPEMWDHVVREIDATSEEAHFYLGVARAKSGDFSGALGSFLLCAISDPENLDAWSNAIICAWSIGEPDQILAVIATALSLSGRQAYDHLRDVLVEQGAADGMLEGLDTIVAELALLRVQPPRDVTLRVLGEPMFDITVSQ